MSKLSNQRKATYYIGMGMTILGFILFISIFFSVIGMMNGGVNSLDPFASNKGPSFGRPLVGMLLMIVGQFVMRVGARGGAGSGIILDPDRAREDLKPYTEAAGGMINDVISNIDAFDQKQEPTETKEIIKVRCRDCSTLNDEDSKFCKACGKPI